MSMDMGRGPTVNPGENFFPSHKELQLPDQRPNYDANERVDQLLLVCAAMWELIREKTNLIESDLIAKVAEIDARDGTVDGKITPVSQPCPQCQRIVFPKHRHCLYCVRKCPSIVSSKTSDPHLISTAHQNFPLAFCAGRAIFLASTGVRRPIAG